MPKDEIKLSLKTGGHHVRLTSRVPDEELRIDDLIPTLHQVTDAIVDASENAAVRKGHKVSCQAGCGACCRQMVPVSDVEMRYLLDYVDSLDGDRTASLHARFRAAEAQLEKSGMLDRLMRAETETNSDDRIELSKDYFRLGIACPFLENESCSIHAVRPAVCREYLVVNDPVHCAALDLDKIRGVNVEPSVNSLLLRYPDGSYEKKSHFKPLALLMKHAEALRNHPPAMHRAPQLLREIYQALENANNKDTRTRNKPAAPAGEDGYTEVVEADSA